MCYSALYIELLYLQKGEFYSDDLHMQRHACLHDQVHKLLIGSLVFFVFR